MAIGSQLHCFSIFLLHQAHMHMLQHVQADSMLGSNMAYSNLQRGEYVTNSCTACCTQYPNRTSSKQYAAAVLFLPYPHVFAYCRSTSCQASSS
jgi:hypothetical protein